MRPDRLVVAAHEGRERRHATRVTAPCPPPTPREGTLPETGQGSSSIHIAPQRRVCGTGRRTPVEEHLSGMSFRCDPAQSRRRHNEHHGSRHYHPAEHHHEKLWSRTTAGSTERGPGRSRQEFGTSWGNGRRLTTCARLPSRRRRRPSTPCARRVLPSRSVAGLRLVRSLWAGGIRAAEEQKLL